MTIVLLAVADTALFIVAVLAILTGGPWLLVAAWALLVVEGLSVAGLARLAAHRNRGTADDV
ncbi:hypothetical protein SEA_PCORAL7_64 [Gordonia phage PCoral7]|uniref:Uncharacterized protein n=1 Tax=Gordonia phage Toast TaxID=2599852 RepID=A0A5J6TCK4_9CAUD|nr:membrane protein [Gordonia phage Toast]QFG08124.1 hypothetical protein PBI_TOAST_64 [Gordonia phage Toast]UVF60572.1 hypothetical protein SEA_PCORAL7_64 [Gordonia phage PCoral7]